MPQFTPNVQIPFRRITGLSQRAQYELFRDFEELSRNLASASVYDVYVDSTLAADSPGTKTFTTPFKAIAYAVDTLALSIVSVGWRNFSGPQTATETGNYAGVGTPTWVTVEVIGAPATNLGGRGNTGMPTWALSTFTDNGKIAGLTIVGLKLTVATNRTTAPIGATQTYAKAAMIQGASGSATTGYALPSGVYVDTLFNQCTFINDSGGHILENCAWESQTLTTVTTPQKFYAYNCRFHAGSNTLTTWTASGTVFVAADCSFVGDNPTGSTFALTYSGSGLCYISTPPNLGFGFASGSHLGLTITAGSGDVTIIGAYRTLTVGASGNVSINAYVRGAIDVTGPAVFSLASTVGGHTLRGAGLSGSITTAYSSGTALSLVGVVRSAIVAAFNGSSTGKAYAIDAASGPGVLVEEGESSGSTASTNLSATFLVINHLGAPPSGPATGDLAGNYPAPTLDLTKAHTWTAEQKAPDLVATGLTGATAASRYVGATASGAPASGTFAVGDFVVDQTGTFWICTAAGTPGSWSKPTSAPTAPSNVVFLANGTFSKATYPGLRAVRVVVVGGGGGGGGAPAPSSDRSVAGGGGGGGYAEVIVPAASLAASETVTVGTGGAGGTAGGAGGNGNTSSFGAWAVATGGTGSSGGNHGTIIIRPSTSGGTGTTGDTLAGGDTGKIAFVMDTAHSISGDGGQGGGGYNGAGRGASGDNVGADATANTGGGGGGGMGTTTLARSGGAGAAGIVVVELVF